jgi:hypothetical protein
MEKSLPKGHVSCLSKTFRYTPAVNTSVARTFARIKRELSGWTSPAPAQAAPTVSRLVIEGRPVRAEAVETARRVLLAGGLRPEFRVVDGANCGA